MSFPSSSDYNLNLTMTGEPASPSSSVLDDDPLAFDLRPLPATPGSDLSLPSDLEAGDVVLPGELVDGEDEAESNTHIIVNSNTGIAEEMSTTNLKEAPTTNTTNVQHGGVKDTAGENEFPRSESSFATITNLAGRVWKVLVLGEDGVTHPEDAETPTDFGKRFLEEKRTEFLEEKRLELLEESTRTVQASESSAVGTLPANGALPTAVLREADHIRCTPLSLLEFYDEENPTEGFNALGRAVCVGATAVVATVGKAENGQNDSAVADGQGSGDSAEADGAADSISFEGGKRYVMVVATRPSFRALTDAWKVAPAYWRNTWPLARGLKGLKSEDDYLEFFWQEWEDVVRSVSDRKVEHIPGRGEVEETRGREEKLVSDLCRGVRTPVFLTACLRDDAWMCWRDVGSTGLTALDLSARQVDEEEGVALGRALETNSSLTWLCLSETGLSEKAGEALAQALEKNSTLKLLDLTDMCWHKKVWLALMEALEVNSALTCLHLQGARSLPTPNDGTDLGGMVGVALVEMLEKNSALTSLNLEGIDLGEMVGIALVGVLEKNSVLTSLELGGRNLSEKVGLALVEVLGKNCMLTSLALQFPELGEKVWLGLAEVLAKNSILMSLGLPYLGVACGNAGVALAKALETNSTLTRLNLRGKGLDEKAGLAFAEALAKNSTLTSLTLETTDLRKDAGAALAKALETNSTLTYLNLQGAGLDEKAGLAFADALEKNSTLTSLDISLNCSFGTEGELAFARALGKNCTLKELNVWWNRKHQLGWEEAEEALVEAVAKNPVLESLGYNYQGKTTPHWNHRGWQRRPRD